MVYIIVSIALSILIVRIYLVYNSKHKQNDKIETKAVELFTQWKDEKSFKEINILAELKFNEWKRVKEKEIRADAISKSHAVYKGKITEHLIPYFSNFKYDPRDVRFLGAPIDLIVFDGLTEGDLKQIIFIEVKSGKTSTLSIREKQIRKCVENKNVFFELIKST